MIAMSSFKDKKILITGGLGHIGRSLLDILASEGAHLIIVDKARDTIATDLKVKYELIGAQFDILDVDLMNPESFQQILNTLNGKLKSLDHIVNLAAFYDKAKGWGVPFEEEGYDAWIKVLKVNVVAPFFLIQALKPLLSKSCDPSIVNVSSMYGSIGPDHRLYEGTGMTNPCVYSVSKAGLNQLTRWLSTVLAPNIRINTVSPGGVERGQPREFIDRYNARTPLKRMCTDREAAEVIAFLLSSKSSYITGQNIVVDGGWTVW